MRDLATLIVASIFFSMPVSAVPITFDWDGQFTVQNPDGSIWSNSDGSPQTAVSGTFEFDPDNPDLSRMSVVTAPFSFLAGGADTNTVLTHTYMQQLDHTALYGEFNIDWCGDPAAFGEGFCHTMYMGIVWDITGLRYAIENTPDGLQVGDKISGDSVVRGVDTILTNIGSATPATDGIETYSGSGIFLEQGPAPMATKTQDYGYYYDDFGYLQFGLYDDGVGGMLVAGYPCDGCASINLDIGSGNSMTVIETVPVPAAVWLFSTGLIGLVGVARLKKS